MRIDWFNAVAEAPELPAHSGSALLLRSFGDCWAAFFVADSLVQDQTRSADTVDGQSLKWLYNIKTLLRRGRGYKNLRYLLVKAQCMAINKTEFIVLQKAA